jgi:hypothetical protein
MDSTTAEESLRKCPHGPCECMIYPEQKYCSIHCSTAENADEIECDCGHLNCGLAGVSRGRKVPSVLDSQIGSPCSR